MHVRHVGKADAGQVDQTVRIEDVKNRSGVNKSAKIKNRLIEKFGRERPTIKKPGLTGL
jgi:hypothetical protein